MIKKISEQRLTKLANFLRSIDANHFNYAEILAKCDGTVCGTVACATGWLPQITNVFRWHKDQNKNFELQYKRKVKHKYEWTEWCRADSDHSYINIGWTNVANYFQISEEDCEYLFEPNEAKYAKWNKGKVFHISNNIEVAEHIMKYIEYRKVHND